ncbi:MAG TPA: tetratricopeptide repeat protein [Pyrinomonadaceae bacterium]|nr:tetratricopeptide repeat protein [Pyrinomonadaceae bacterium]
MNHKECPRSGSGRSLSSVLLAFVVAALACATLSCSNPEKAKAEHVQRGEAYLTEKKYQEASLEFRNAVQIDDKLAQAHWGLARAYEGMEQFTQAFEELMRTVALDANNLDARIRLGNYYILASQRTDIEEKVRDEFRNKAEQLVKEVLDKDPNNIEGHILRGTVLFASGKREEAFAALNRAVELDPKRIESLMSLALFHRQMNDPAKAEEVYKRALSINDNSSLAHLEYAKFFVAQNRQDMAEREFRRAVEVDPQNRDAQRTLASFYLVNKQFDRAEEAFKAIAQLDGDRPEGRALLADFYASVGRYDEAANIYQDIVSKYADYARGRHRLAELMLQRGDQTGALAQVEDALKKNASDREALILRARLRLNQDRAKDAIEDLKQVLKIEPRDQAGLYFMAEATFRAGQMEQTRIFAGDLEKYYPDYLPAKLMQVQINLAAGDNANAQRLANDLLARLDKAAPDSRNSPQLLNELRAKTLTARATTYLQTKNYSAARADFTAARDLSPNAPSSHANLAAAAAAEGKADEAVGHYEQALKLDAANFEALNGLINLYMAQGKFEQAHARVDQALAARPNTASLYFLKSSIYGKQQDAPNAEAALRRTLELDSSFVPAINALGSLYVNTNRPDEAVAEFRRMSEKRPDDPTPYMLIGMVEDGRKNYDASTEAYKRALTVNAESAFAANNLAWNYAEHGKGNLDEAVRLAQGVVQKFPDEPGFADTLGWVYYKKGLYAAAVEQLQKAVRQTEARAAKGNGTDSALYRYHLGMALAALGRKPEARQQLQQAVNMTKGTKLSPDNEQDARKALASK